MKAVEPSSAESVERSRFRSPEARLWIFMRLSGLILLFLALIHFAITHIINDVVETSSAFVDNRWENPLWRVFDWALLALALTHGLNGVGTIVEDYVRNPRRRKIVMRSIIFVTGVMFLYGTYTVVTY